MTICNGIKMTVPLSNDKCLSLDTCPSSGDDVIQLKVMNSSVETSEGYKLFYEHDLNYHDIADMIDALQTVKDYIDKINPPEPIV